MTYIGPKSLISFILVIILCPFFMAAENDLEFDLEHNPWRSDTQKALMELRGKSKILLLSADWCHWCTQLQEDSKSNIEAKKILQKLHGIVVKTDDYPDLMQHYGVRGLPSLVLINNKERVVNIHTGYLPAARLTSLLQEWDKIKHHEGRIPSGLYEDMEYDKIVEMNGVKGVINQLGQGTRGQRIYLRERLAKEKNVDVLLWPLLTHKSLAVRIDVSKVLTSRHGDFSDYDAFAGAKQRALGAQKWEKSVKVDESANKKQNQH